MSQATRMCKCSHMASRHEDDYCTKCTCLVFREAVDNVIDLDDIEIPEVLPEETFDEPVLVDDEDIDDEPAPGRPETQAMLQCTHPGCMREFKTGQALSLHRRRAHEGYNPAAAKPKAEPVEDVVVEAEQLTEWTVEVDKQLLTDFTEHVARDFPCCDQPAAASSDDAFFPGELVESTTSWFEADPDDVLIALVDALEEVWSMDRAAELVRGALAVRSALSKRGFVIGTEAGGSNLE